MPKGFAEAPQAALDRPSPFLDYRAVMAGIPATEVKGLLALGLTRADIRRVIPDRTLDRRIANGAALTLAEADGLARLLRVVNAARDLFANDANADEWLRNPIPTLGDRIPIVMARTDLGAREVEAVLGRIAHGVY